MFQALAKEVKFKYKFQLEPNGAYGSLKNGKWTGMIAELRSQQADMAAIDMSITSIRQQAVDFTMPFMNTGQPSQRRDNYHHRSFMKTQVSHHSGVTTITKGPS